MDRDSPRGRGLEGEGDRTKTDIEVKFIKRTPTMTANTFPWR